jgi:integrase
VRKGAYYEYLASAAALGRKAHKVAIDVRIDGEPKRSARVFATKADADIALALAETMVAEWRADAAKRAALVDAMPPLPPTPRGVELFDTVVDEWLTLHIEPHRTAGTLAHYRWLMDTHIRPVMRAWPLDDTITRSRVYNQVVPVLATNGATYNTRRAAVTCLSAFFEYARTREHTRLTVNPAWKLKILKPTTTLSAHAPGPNPMSPEQAAAYLDWIYEHQRPWWEFFLALHDTGVRVGEVSALKWAHVTLAAKRATICESFSSEQRRYEIRHGVDPKRDAAFTVGEKDTKTHHDREIVLTTDLADAWDELRAAQRKAALRRGRPVPAHVHTNDKGHPRRPDNYAHRVHRAACDALKLRGERGRPFVIHDLRDTYASLQIMAGTPIERVSKQLGHRDVSTTRKYYATWLDRRDGDGFADKVARQGTRKGTKGNR